MTILKKITAKFPGVRVLIADDYAINQELLQEMLKKMECKTDVASDGKQTVEMHQHNTYDMILMDIQMPELDGYDATRLIRTMENEQRHTPIVAITANALTGDREKCLASGMDDYISKPIKAEDLERVLTTYFRKGVPS